MKKRFWFLAAVGILVVALAAPAAFAAITGSGQEVEPQQDQVFFDQMFDWHQGWLDQAQKNSGVSPEQAKAWQEHFSYMRDFHAQNGFGPMGSMMDGEGLNGMMGSGGMVVLDEDDCMVEMARFFLDFTQKESCGKCTFCRLGTKHMLTILENITKGQGKPEDLELLLELAGDVKAGSLCGLGKTAPNPVLSTVKYFRDEYEAHIHEKRCPALMCKDLIAYYILPEKCERSCNACVGSCPVEAIFDNEDRIKVIDQKKCVKCDSCMVACPPQYKAVVKLSPPEAVAEYEKGKRS